MSGRESRCYTYKGTHIPGCYGCAIYGGGRRDHKRYCTCPPKDSPLNARIERVERRLAKLLQFQRPKLGERSE